VAFGYKIVIENRVSVRFLEESLLSMVGERSWEAAVCASNNKFDRAKNI